MKSFYKRYFVPVYDNDVDSLNPTIWAQESLAVLEEQMIASTRINRDYENKVQEFGEVVNANRPAKFEVERKGANDDVVVQNADSNQLPITLNQHLHTSFLLRDAQVSKSMQSLFDMFLTPAVQSIASGLDKAILGFAPQFLGNAYGQLDGMTEANAKNYIIQTRKMMVDGLLPAAKDGLITPATEAIFLELPIFTEADKVGDDGTALREASIGRKYGMNWFMGQNTPYVNTATAYKATGAVNRGGGYVAGSTIILIDGFSAAIVNGSYVTIAGSMYPYRVTATIGAGTPTSMTVTPALREPVADNAVVSVYRTGAIDLGAGYAAGWVKRIHVDGLDATYPPQVGQIVSHGADIYTIMSITGNTGTEADILLNRPVVSTMADNDVLGFGPGGSYNFCFARDALGLVTRPLALPRADTGVRGAVASFNDLSIRVVMTYDGNKQGHLVTVDMLCGIAVFDTGQGFLMLG